MSLFCAENNAHFWEDLLITGPEIGWESNIHFCAFLNLFSHCGEMCDTDSSARGMDDRFLYIVFSGSETGIQSVKNKE